MNADRSQQLIVGCLAASGAIAAGSALASDSAPGLRMLVGFGVTGVSLALVAQFAPDLAGSFAILILTTTLLTTGAPFLDAVTSLTTSGTLK